MVNAINLCECCKLFRIKLLRIKIWQIIYEKFNMNVGIKCWDDSQVELFYSIFNGIGQGLT
jgi:hypothetical protein